MTGIKTLKLHKSYGWVSKMHINKNASLWVKPTKVNNRNSWIPRHLQQQWPLHDIWWPLRDIWWPQGSTARTSHHWNCSVVCHPYLVKTHFIGFCSNVHCRNMCCNTLAIVVRLATEEPSFDTASVWHILARKMWHRSSLEWSCSLPPEKFYPSCSLLQLLDIETGNLQSDRIAGDFP